MRQVYFLRPIGLVGPVKIGVSIMPDWRLASYMKWSPLPLEIAATTPGDESLERAFHARFADLRLHHEWFSPSPLIDQTIDEINAGTFNAAALPPAERRHGPRSPETRSAIGYRHKLGRLQRAGVRVPAEIEAAARADYRTRPDIREQCRALVRAFVDGHPTPRRGSAA